MKVVALAGGVGGAKLADGLARILPPGDLTIIVNTGDDFVYHGLSISPDLDTVCYTLAGLSNPETGWGQRDETWKVFEQLRSLGAPSWFRLGDKDMATHLERTRLLAEGKPLSMITRRLCEKWGVQHFVIPMTNHQVATRIKDKTGRILDFQEYFVKYKWEPEVDRVIFDGIEQASPCEEAIDALNTCELVIICPSNPYVSIIPILALPGVVDILRKKPVIAVSPIIGGKAVKGPLAKMIREIDGVEPSALFVADYYNRMSILKGFVLDHNDHEQLQEIERWGIIIKEVNTLMLSTSDRIRLAEESLALGRQMLRRNNHP
jgi:LPPG:FO 2-phospho-L-lactate transferase